MKSIHRACEKFTSTLVWGLQTSGNSLSGSKAVDLLALDLKNSKQSINFSKQTNTLWGKGKGIVRKNQDGELSPGHVCPSASRARSFLAPFYMLPSHSGKLTAMTFATHGP